MSITTSTGTIIKLEGNLVILDHRDAPADMHDFEVGRVVGGAFQPAPFCGGAMRPETLRAIADLIEKES